MILTCPTCASQYSLDEQKLAGRARTVRCVACRATWTISPPSVDPAPLPPEPPKPSEPTPEAAAESVGPTAEIPLPLVYRAKSAARKKTRAAALAGLVWGGLAAAVLVLVGSALLFRAEVVRLWPRTAGAYARLGLPVNPLGLAPENVEAGPGLVNGQAAVVVTGQLRNVQSRPTPPQPLRVALLDKDGKRLAEQVAKPEPGAIPPNGVRNFQVQFIDPPAASKDVEVEFAFDLMDSRTAAAPHASRPIKVRDGGTPAASPRPAEPLPDHSPDALPEAAARNNPQAHTDG